MKKKSSKNLPYVICRCYYAGVHAGYLVSHKGREVELKNSRRLWQWWSDFTLSAMAKVGPRMDKPQKYAMPVEKIILTEVCEIITCTNEAREKIESVFNYVE